MGNPDPSALPAEIEERGFDYVKETDSNLDCSICRVPFIDPVMSSKCYHIFCRNCLQQALQVSPVCPIDRYDLDPEQVRPAPKLIRQMCDELEVKCAHHEAGCTHTCQRQALANHLKNDCQFAQTGCSSAECNETIRKKDLRRHLETCEYRLVDCEMCHTSIRFKDLKDHHTSCPKSTVTCKHCSERMTLSSLQDHLEKCPDKPIECPHSRFGCKVTSTRRIIEEAHLLNCPFEGIKSFFPIVEKKFEQYESENSRLRERLDMVLRRESDTRNELENLRRSLGPFYFPQRTRSINIDQDGPSPTHQNLDLVQHLSELSVNQGGNISSQPPHHMPPISSSLPSEESDHLEQSDIDNDHHHDHNPTLQQQPPPQAQDEIVPEEEYDNVHQQPISTSANDFEWPTSFESTEAPLTETLRTLKSSIEILSQNFDTLHHRRDMNFMNETVHLQDEVQSLRAAVHFIRLQQHNMLMDRRESNSYAARGASSNVPSSSSSDKWANKDDRPASPMGSVVGYDDSGPSHRYPTSRPFYPPYGPGQGPPPGPGPGPGPRYGFSPYGRRPMNQDPKL